MATTTTVTQRGLLDPSDPFFYGWRDVLRVTPTGREVWDMIPLTEEEILHPQEGDHVSQNNVHGDWCRYLVGVCEMRVAGDPSALVLSDVLIAWDVPTLKPHAPDVAVIFGVRVRERRQWGTFPVAEEGVRPDLVIEVTSPATVENDLKKKVRQYARAKVPQYVIVDGVIDRQTLGPVRLVDYRLVGRRYVVQPPDAQGWVWLAAVQVWLGMVDGEPVCFDENGQRIGGITAQAARADTEAARADTEAARAANEAAARAEAETRVRALEEELRRLRGQ